MKDRLTEAKCAKHSDGYDRECGICVMRYYHFLINDNYVPRYKYDDLARSLRAAQAMAESRRVEADFLRGELDQAKLPDWTKRGRIDPARTRR